MPYLNIQTNRKLSSEQEAVILRKSSALVATILGKPEEYVMVSLKDEVPMLFAGSDAPLAYLELKSIGLQAEKTKDFAKEFCEFVSTELDIPGERVYVKFNDAQRSMWGWNGDTFG